MPKFRKKPVVVEAVLYAGSGNLEPRGAVPDWMWKAYEDGTLKATNGGDPLIVKTLEGDMTVSPGDWIIRGTEGEIYPCKPKPFETTFDDADKGDARVDKLARDTWIKTREHRAFSDKCIPIIADAIRTALTARGVIPLDAADSVLLEIMLDASVQLSGEAKQKLQALYTKQPLAISANLQRALESS